MYTRESPPTPTRVKPPTLNCHAPRAHSPRGTGHIGSFFSSFLVSFLWGLGWPVASLGVHRGGTVPRLDLAAPRLEEQRLRVVRRAGGVGPGPFPHGSDSLGGRHLELGDVAANCRHRLGLVLAVPTHRKHEEDRGGEGGGPREHPVVLEDQHPVGGPQAAGHPLALLEVERGALKGVVRQLAHPQNLLRHRQHPRRRHGNRHRRLVVAVHHAVHVLPRGVDGRVHDEPLVEQDPGGRPLVDHGAVHPNPKERPCRHLVELQSKRVDQEVGPVRKRLAPGHLDGYMVEDFLVPSHQVRAAVRHC
mmetsp:Transcript_13442/g.34444  ORF Transcript_13442/g.34444 Transcript_13442/m.34444 type:complete len:304 (-) Transcript_13442:167-1078(-)